MSVKWARSFGSGHCRNFITASTDKNLSHAYWAFCPLAEKRAVGILVMAASSMTVHRGNLFQCELVALFIQLSSCNLPPVLYLFPPQSILQFSCPSWVSYSSVLLFFAGSQHRPHRSETCKLPSCFRTPAADEVGSLYFCPGYYLLIWRFLRPPLRFHSLLKWLRIRKERSISLAHKDCCLSKLEGF